MTHMRFSRTARSYIQKLIDGSIPPSLYVKSNNLIRMIAVCTKSITEDEMKDFQAEDLASMPDAYVEIAKDRTASKSFVDGLDDNSWAMIQVAATSIMEQMSSESGAGGDGSEL